MDPRYIAYEPGTGKQTDIELKIVHNGKTYVSSASMTYKKEGPRFHNEVMYQVANALSKINRDLKADMAYEQAVRQTNPFAWS